MHLLEARILISSRDHARAPHGWTVIELEQGFTYALAIKRSFNVAR